MRSILMLSLLAVITIMASCGPSEAELEQAWRDAEHYADSTRKATAEKLTTAQGDLYMMQEQLIQVKAELAKAEDRLRRVNNFQMLRSRAEREAQIAAATADVERLRLLIAELEPIAAKQKALRDQLEQQVMTGR